MKIKDIRNIFIDKLKNNELVIDKTGVKTLEIVGASFLADQDTIIRKPNLDYVKREIKWYESQSLKVDDIPGETPAIWNAVASDNGKINSNYGYLIYSKNNGYQYDNVVSELIRNPDSRRATMIYQRPSMHTDFNVDGMSDFICTFAHTYLIRNGKLNVVVMMRSNDAVFGYVNDYHWAKYIQEKMAKQLNIPCGDIHWQAASLHVYERHFKFVEKLWKKKKNQ